jgi:hypothetical protein
MGTNCEPSFIVIRNEGNTIKYCAQAHTRELAERIIRVKAMPMADDRQRELVQKTVLGSLNRAKQTIMRVETAGVVSWRLS